MEERRTEGLCVKPHPRADLRDAHRVDDEVLAGAAPLVGVVLAGEHERLNHAVAVDRLGDLVGVLLDDREQVVQQRPLDRCQVGRDIGGQRARRRVGEVDGTVGRDGDRNVGLGRAAGDRRARFVLLRSQAACRVVSLVRYWSPSSSLRW